MFKGLQLWWLAGAYDRQADAIRHGVVPSFLCCLLSSGSASPLDNLELFGHRQLPPEIFWVHSAAKHQVSEGSLSSACQCAPPGI